MLQDWRQKIGELALHTELLKKDVLADFHALWSDKVSNKTNGITPRRWLVLSNPRLTKLSDPLVLCYCPFFWI
jgi:glucan phosphorylase